MELFHFSSSLFDVLEPSFGENRHDSEDPSIVGKSVIFLTNKSDRAPGVENTAKYRYRVEINENDPNLFVDQSKEALKKSARESGIWSESSIEAIEITYFYTKSLAYIEVDEIA
ncbi:hypothetical protein AB4370_22230 [Vibrio cyclitrophicus]